MKLATSSRNSELRSILKFSTAAVLVSILSACSTTHASSCEKLAKNQRGEISKMVKRFERSASGRHVILLETGSGLSDLCRTHFIDKDEYIDLPSSASTYCWKQERGTDTYCTVYSVDGEYIGKRVDM